MEFTSGPLKHNHYFAELSLSKEIDSDIKNFINKIKLDINFNEDKNKEYQITDKNGRILAKPYKLSSKQKDYTLDTTGYVSVKYQKTGENSLNIYKPPIAIPIGCYCIKCKGDGYSGHDTRCESITPFSDLYITIEGVIYAFDKIKHILTLLGSSEEENKLKKEFKAEKKYSNMIRNLSTLLDSDKTIEEILQNKIRKIDIINKFINIVDEELKIKYEEPNNIKLRIKNIKNKLSEYEQNQKITEDVIFFNKSENVTILKYDMFYPVHEPKPFSGAILISYVYPNKNKTNIRINKDNIITFVALQYVENEKPFFLKFLKDHGLDGNVKNVIISSFNLSFEILLKKQSIDVNKVKDIFENNKKTIDGIEGLNYSKNEPIFTIENIKTIKNKKVLVVKLNKYIQDKNNKYISTDDSVVVSIYKTGKVQLTYNKPNKSNKHKDISPVSYDDQFKNINKTANQVKDLIIALLNKNKSDSLLYKEDTKKLNLWPTISGQMPYVNHAKVSIGSVIEIFDRELGKWSGNQAIVLKDTIKDSNNNKIYTIVSTDFIKEIEKSKIKNVNELDYFQDIVYKNKNYKFLKVENNNIILLKIREKYQKLLKFDDFRVLFTKYGDKSADQSKSSVADTKVRPFPYSFYGLCPNSQTAIINRIGNRAISDNRYYPFCKIYKEKDYQDQKQKLWDFIFGGLNEEEIESGNVISKNDPVIGEINDFYAGTFLPGTNEINSHIKYWDTESSTWKTGTIFDIKYNKEKGTEEEKHKLYVIQPDKDEEDNDNDPNEYPVITGEQFHPDYRESRNFIGLNNINENKLKDVLISCALDMNLVNKDINNLQNIENKNTIIHLSEILNEEFSFKNIVHKTKCMDIDNINNLSKYDYDCFIIPKNSVRSVLFINKQKHRIINKKNKVYKCKIEYLSNNENQYILDGFYSNKDRIFYILDMKYSSNPKQSLKEFVKNIKTFNNSESNINIAYVYGPIGENLYTFISNNVSEENEFIFKRKDNDNDSPYLHLYNKIYNPYLTFQIIKNNESDQNQWILGMDDRAIPGVYNLRSSERNLESKYVKLKLNFNNKDGEIYTTDNQKDRTKKIITPYYDIHIIDEESVNKKHLSSYDDLQNIYHNLINSIHMCVFNNDIWKFTIYNNNGTVDKQLFVKEDKDNPHKLKVSYF